MLLGIGGVAFIVESRLSIGGDDHLRGILLSIAAMLSLVGGTILFKRFAPKEGLWLGNGVQSLAAGMATMPFALAFENVGDIVVTWRLRLAFADLVASSPSSPTCSGSAFSRCRARRPPVPIAS